MKIYTKTGDKGMTRLIGGAHVSKDSNRVAAYGTLDELNSLIGYIVSQMGEVDNQDIKADLLEIQQYLFDCGTDLATPDGIRDYRLTKEPTKWLEDRIDIYTEIPPKIEEFILPGGTPIASQSHMARTVTRRGERSIVSVSWTAEINQHVLKFTNRLSDYFFAAARVANFRSGCKDVSYIRSGKVFHHGPDQKGPE